MSGMRLGSIIAEYRYAKRISGRNLAAEIGVSHATLNRFERIGMCDGATLALVLRWLLESADLSYDNSFAIDSRKIAGEEK